MSQAPVAIRAEPLTSAVARALIAALDAELSARYPEEGATHFRLDADELAPGRGVFLVAYAGDQPIGCGAVRTIAPGVAEIKRMFVAPAARGRGLGALLLGALERHAQALGAARVVLETGARQAEAIAMYRRAGYEPMDPFGEYVDSPLSICMQRALPS
jgi:GNAT superfamily N-acetyltransferase